MAKRTAIVLLNLGAPDSLDSVPKFLTNLFSDPAIIDLPWPWRHMIARFIATRRVVEARKIYQYLGGCSPLLANTKTQAAALDDLFDESTRVFIAMRYWHPQSVEVARKVKLWDPDEVVLLPLYPQYSTATTASSVKAWKKAQNEVGLEASHRVICCYPSLPGFIASHVQLIDNILTRIDEPYRVLFSAHGLPKRVIKRGDPYQWQVEQTASSVAKKLIEKHGPSLRWTVCYQSRVGPLEWIGPSTEEELKRSGHKGENVVVAPIAFVSEHSETLVELDITYQRLAKEFGVQNYERVPALSLSRAFISALAELVRASSSVGINSQDRQRICPHMYHKCPYVN